MAEAAHLAGRKIILCADDYAQNGAITEAILDLAAAGRLSATSAMVTCSRWTGDAPRIMALRDRVAVGLHLNLTHGKPLGPMPGLAPDGAFPPVGTVIRKALARRLDAAEIGAEIDRQLDAFEAGAGAPPDHVDGHQHVHSLPGIGSLLIAALARRYPGRAILLRDPSDSLAAIFARGSALKALVVAGLSRGFARRARAAGFVLNRGFSGFSDFGETPYAAEFARFLRRAGQNQMIMCHPGRAAMPPDADDPIGARRPAELAVLSALPDLPGLLWHPGPRAAGDAPAWPEGMSDA